MKVDPLANKRPHYNIVLYVYRASILKTRRDYIVLVIEKAKHPVIFDHVQKLDARVPVIDR